MVSKDNGKVSLRQYVESLIAESDKRSDAQFAAAKEAVAAALAAAKEAVAAALVAQDKLTAAAFLAAKEALTEAQSQLIAYKATANEWRGTLNDLITSVNKSIADLKLELSNSISDLKIELKENFDDKLSAHTKRLEALEGQGRFTSGQTQAADANRVQIHWTFSQILAVITILLFGLATSVSLAALFFRMKP